MTSPTLQDRYGAPSRSRQWLVVAACGLLALAFAAWLGWTAVSHGDPEVESELVSWTVDSDHAVTARLAVRLGDDDVVATCLLRATAEDHTVVGELSFDVDAAALEGGDTVTREIRTERRATSVDAVGCTTPDQQRPR